MDDETVAMEVVETPPEIASAAQGSPVSLPPRASASSSASSLEDPSGTAPIQQATVPEHGFAPHIEKTGSDSTSTSGEVFSNGNTASELGEDGFSSLPPPTIKEEYQQGDA